MKTAEKETQLAVQQPEKPEVRATDRGVAFGNLGEMREFAVAVVNSGIAPKDFRTPEAVLVAMQHGMELGLSPMQALHSIAVINGRPVIYGDAALAIVKSHPSFLDAVETFDRGKTDDEMKATCEVKRVDQTPVVRSFSVAQAKKAGLWGKAGPWTQYPQRMLQMRARSFALRDSFPDALKGFRVGEEERDIEPRPVQARVVSREMVLPGDEPKKIEDAPAIEPADQDGALTHPETGEPMNPDGTFKF